MKRLALISILCLTACDAITSPAPGPVVQYTGASPSPIASISQPNPTTHTADIASIVNGSACTTYKWRDRGTAPKGFVMGMAQAFQRSLCRKDPVMNKALGDTDHDALAAYSISASLINNYTLLMGLGMRESSGKYCEGRDTSSKGTPTADTAEAGTFQTSYNSHDASPDDLGSLWAWYKANPQACDLSTWKAGVDPAARECAPATVGSGLGASWQDFVKACPAFGAEYAATLIRVLRAHYGPLVRKEAEFNKDCQAMFTAIQGGTVCP